MRTVSRAVDARPAFRPTGTRLPTRTLLGTGLTALVLPLCVATPALAGTPKLAAGPTATAATSGPTPVATAVRVSVPRGAVAPGAQRVGVRVIAGGRFLPNASVVVQKHSPTGWVPTARVRTDARGHAVAMLPVSASTAVRATFSGTATAAPTASRLARVTVGRSASARSAGAGSGFRSVAIRVARAQAGKPYRYGSAGPSSFDCSGLVNFAFRAAGKSLPRTSGALRATTQRVSKSAAVPGDLIFTPGHVGIYLGGGKMVDAPRTGRSVSVRSIYSRNYTVGRIA